MKRSIVLIKQETTFGDETLTLTGADAVVVSDFNMKRREGEKKERNHDHQGIGNQVEINVDEHTMTDFGMEASAQGTPGDPPANGFIIEACGFDRADALGVSVTYSVPDTIGELRTGRKSVAIEEHDPDTNMKQNAFGCIGNLAFEAAAKDYSKFLVSGMRGSYIQPVPGVAPTVAQSVYDEFKDPVTLIKDHIKTATLDGYDICPLSFKYNWGLNVADLGTCDQLFYAGFTPSLELVMKAVDVNAKNIWALDGKIVPIALGIADKDDTAGQRIDIVDNEVQIYVDDKAEQDGVRLLTITGRPIGKTADIVFS